MTDKMCRVLGPEQSEFIHPTKLRFSETKLLILRDIKKEAPWEEQSELYDRARNFFVPGYTLLRPFIVYYI